MRVLMVDDHVMFLQALKNLLRVLAGDLVVDTVDNIAHAVRMCVEARYDLVLLDWNLEGCAGEEAIRRLRDGGCTARIVVLSGENDSSIIRAAVDMGAAGFIPKRYSSELMVSALDVVLNGGIYLPAEAMLGGAEELGTRGAPSSSLAQRLDELTPRQLDVYKAAARGLSNKLIARELGVAESTVKTHLSAIYGALGVSNRTEAAWQASREGIRIG
jgi:DNA-binding NarL/FixJ family response regulator